MSESTSSLNDQGSELPVEIKLKASVQVHEPKAADDAAPHESNIGRAALTATEAPAAATSATFPATTPATVAPPRLTGHKRKRGDVLGSPEAVVNRRPLGPTLGTPATAGLVNGRARKANGRRTPLKVERNCANCKKVIKNASGKTVCSEECGEAERTANNPVEGTGDSSAVDGQCRRRVRTLVDHVISTLTPKSTVPRDGDAAAATKAPGDADAAADAAKAVIFVSFPRANGTGRRPKDVSEIRGFGGDQASCISGFIKLMTGLSVSGDSGVPGVPLSQLILAAASAQKSGTSSRRETRDTNSVPYGRTPTGCGAAESLSTSPSPGAATITSKRWDSSLLSGVMSKDPLKFLSQARTGNACWAISLAKLVLMTCDLRKVLDSLVDVLHLAVDAGVPETALEVTWALAVLCKRLSLADKDEFNDLAGNLLRSVGQHAEVRGQHDPWTILERALDHVSRELSSPFTSTDASKEDVIVSLAGATRKALQDLDRIQYPMRVVRTFATCDACCAYGRVTVQDDTTRFQSIMCLPAIFESSSQLQDVGQFSGETGRVPELPNQSGRQKIPISDVLNSSATFRGHGSCADATCSGKLPTSTRHTLDATSSLSRILIVTVDVAAEIQVDPQEFLTVSGLRFQLVSMILFIGDVERSLETFSAPGGGHYFTIHRGDGDFWFSANDGIVKRNDLSSDAAVEYVSRVRVLTYELVGQRPNTVSFPIHSLERQPLTTSQLAVPPAAWLAEALKFDGAQDIVSDLQARLRATGEDLTYNDDLPSKGNCLRRHILHGLVCGAGSLFGALSKKWMNGDAINSFVAALNAREAVRQQPRMFISKTLLWDYLADATRFPLTASDAFFDFQAFRNFHRQSERDFRSRIVKEPLTYAALSSLSLWCIPVNLIRYHWTWVLIDFTQRTLTYFDTMPCSNEVVQSKTSRILSFLYWLEGGTPQEWKVWTTPPNYCRQRNGRDCGLWVCLVLLHLHHTGKIPQGIELPAALVETLEGRAIVVDTVMKTIGLRSEVIPAVPQTDD